MRWGERKAPWYPIADYEAHLRRVGDNGEGTLSRDQRLALSNLKTSKTSNLEKFGRSPKTNVLYIAGYSGSGKSTTALGLKRTGDTIIHLDAYSESSSELVKIRNRKFNEYLSNHGFNYKKLANDGRMKENHNNEYWKNVDRFFELIQQYAADEYKNGHRVICEGVQIADNWLTSENTNYSEFKGKPMIVLRTNPFKSSQRAFERDGRGDNLLKAFNGLEDKYGYIKWQIATNKKLNLLVKSVEAKTNRDDYLKFIL